METKTTIYQLHAEHAEWKSKLNFYKDELVVMQNRISEIASKNSSKEVLAYVEHFQNELIIQKEQIDILAHEINVHEQALEKEVNKNEVAVDHRKVPDHASHREQMVIFEKIINDLRKELNQFLAKRM